MNIFVLDRCPVRAARALCDKHVPKMIVEGAQLLSTAHSELGSWRVGMYQPTHKNHPCAIWVRSTASNYRWLLMHTLALCYEYTRRYKRTHKTLTVIRQLPIPPNIPSGELTPFAQAMPERYKNPDAVAAYRAYYIGDKSRFAVWRHSPTPDWWPST